MEALISAGELAELLETEHGILIDRLMRKAV